MVKQSHPPGVHFPQLLPRYSSFPSIFARISSFVHSSAFRKSLNYTSEILSRFRLRIQLCSKCFTGHYLGVAELVTQLFNCLTNKKGRKPVSYPQTTILTVAGNSESHGHFLKSLQNLEPGHYWLRPFSARHNCILISGMNYQSGFCW